MGIKEKFIEWTEKTDRRQQDREQLGSIGKVNNRYHKYFQGYTEYTYVDSKGKPKIKRVYTGPYFKAALTNPIYYLIRVLYVLLWIGGVILQFSSVLTDYGYNYNKIVAFIEALGFPLSFSVMIGVFTTLLADRNLKIRQYNSIHRTMPKVAAAGFAVHLACSIAMVIYIIVAKDVVAGIWFPPLMLLGTSLLFLIIAIIESRLDYDWVENPVKPQPGGVEISYNKGGLFKS